MPRAAILIQVQTNQDVESVRFNAS